jgi:hypothetical protein
MLKIHSIKSLALLGYAFASLCLLATMNPAAAEDAPIIYQPDPDSPIGTRNLEGPPELAQFEFLIGDWDVDMVWYWDGVTPTKSKAKWHNRWIINGNAVMMEWRGPQFTGAEIRQWDARQNKWVGTNIYPDFGPDMPAATAEKVGDEMHVFIPYEDQQGPYINRETYYDIQADSYKMKSDISRDGGKTWTRGMYEMTVTRTKK